ncbi:MAG: phage tail sheath family protein [Ardenticatenaceae bacterium]|nr:phage tail sheath family protein [Ardenticatenaceae bacterium]
MNRSPLPNYSAPGVYIQEVSGGSRPIQAVGTSTAGFVGTAPASKTASVSIAADNLKATVIDNWTQFRDSFFTKPTADNAANHEWTNLAHAVYGFFLNGGHRCWVVDMGVAETAVQLEAALDVLATIDEIAIVAAPGFTDPPNATNNPGYYAVMQNHFAKHDLHDRVFIVDAPKEVADAQTLSTYQPTAVATEQGFTTMYAPWILVADPQPGQTVTVPPSGHVAGIWARSDATRGVHKAPANEVVNGALGLTHNISEQTQAALNRNNINAIRYLPDNGYLVWGSRTVATNQEWKYLNVRRLFNMIEKSIAESTRWVVFEPNDEQLWAAIRRDVSAFLTDFWRQGMLMGSTPQEAFFVKCDAENNLFDSIQKGRVIIDVGIAPVHPAEFVIFRISQYEAGVDVEVA